jgi:hypothetical protein
MSLHAKRVERRILLPTTAALATATSRRSSVV